MAKADKDHTQSLGRSIWYSPHQPIYLEEWTRPPPAPLLRVTAATFIPDTIELHQLSNCLHRLEFLQQRTDGLASSWPDVCPAREAFLQVTDHANSTIKPVRGRYGYKIHLRDLRGANQFIIFKHWNWINAGLHHMHLLSRIWRGKHQVI